MAGQKQSAAWVCVARVAAAHGLRGAFKLRCFTERAEDVAAYGPLYDRAGDRHLILKIIGQSAAGVLAKARGVDDRDAAEALRGTLLYVPRAALPEPADDEFYHADLEGLAAELSDGSRLGTVRAVGNFGAGDVLEIAADGGGVLNLPFDRTTVPLVDLAGGRLVVVPPAELVAEPRP
jgi:16S rRNA processing protein RimM